jgi:hypothetical protein
MVDKLEGHEVRDPRGLRAPIEVQLDQAAEELTRRLAGRMGYQAVRDAVTDAYQRLARQAKVHSFLPILAARSAHERLQAAP